MSERGVFAVDRGIWEHDLFLDSEPLSRREAWMWLISEAAWKPHRRRIGGRAIDLDRGQYVGSLRFIASKWRWSEPRVRRFLATLILECMIDAKTDAGVTVITIRNYGHFQRTSLPTDAIPERHTDAGATQERRKVEDKEDKEISEAKASERPKREARVRTSYPEAFEGFWRSYPTTPLMSKKEAFTAWRRLSESDQQAASAAIPAFSALLRSKPDHPVVHACRFLTQRRFDGFAAQAPPTAPASGNDRFYQERGYADYADYLRKTNAQADRAQVRGDSRERQNGADHAPELQLSGGVARVDPERKTQRGPPDH